MRFGVVLFVLLLLAIAGSLIAFLFPLDTRYAPGYTERGFRSIRMGDTEEGVIKRLGPAFRTNICKPFVQWVYSGDEQKAFARRGEARGKYSLLTFRGESLDSVHEVSETRTGLGSVRIVSGPGVGFLGLNAEQVEKLKGTTMAAVKERFGTPKGVHESNAARILSYSWSPSGGNYRRREVQLDAGGRVVRVERSIWWD